MASGERLRYDSVQLLDGDDDDDDSDDDGDAFVVVGVPGTR